MFNEANGHGEPPEWGEVDHRTGLKLTIQARFV